ncbi:hypothetical protein RIF29_32370 [Crotalaria pallida]|uniref:Uncharacterized protein n=1 Tax=Crotalaria pallida TaxID=3830 RepID=A0AAN9EIM8_CROPI
MSGKCKFRPNEIRIKFTRCSHEIRVVSHRRPSFLVCVEREKEKKRKIKKEKRKTLITLFFSFLSTTTTFVLVLERETKKENLGEISACSFGISARQSFHLFFYLCNGSSFIFTLVMMMMMMNYYNTPKITAT